MGVRFTITAYIPTREELILVENPTLDLKTGAEETVKRACSGILRTNRIEVEARTLLKSKHSTTYKYTVELLIPLIKRTFKVVKGVTPPPTVRIAL